MRWLSEVDSLTNSMPRCDSPPPLPEGTASTTLPSTRAPRSAMMKPSITSGFSSVAKKLSPTSLRDADRLSPIRTGSTVPFARTTVFGTRTCPSAGGAEGGACSTGAGGVAAGSGAGGAGGGCDASGSTTGAGGSTGWGGVSGCGGA